MLWCIAMTEWFEGGDQGEVEEWKICAAGGACGWRSGQKGGGKKKAGGHGWTHEENQLIIMVTFWDLWK